MAYEKIGFTDGTTPLDMENFNHMEDGIAANDEALDSKADQTEIDELKEEVEQLNADLTDLDILGQTGESISANSDLNDFTTCGKYYSSGSGVSSTLENCPYGYAFSLFVMRAAANDNYRIQILIAAASNPTTYIRFKSASSWGNWYQISMSTVSATSVGNPVVMGEDES